MKKQLIYIASPHSHNSSFIREYRYYKEALKCTSWLVRNGFWVFSPIVHSHNLDIHKSVYKGRQEWEYWKEFDTEMITRCDELWVLMIEGTKDSIGVSEEIKIARLQEKVVKAISIDYRWDSYSYMIQDYDE